MSVICKECGFENEDGEKYCAMCNMALAVQVSAPVVEMTPSVPYVEDNRFVQTNTAPQAAVQVSAPQTNMQKRYFVDCENSRTKTIVNSRDIGAYYCSGCKEEHQIDGFFWIVQEEVDEEKPQAPVVAEPVKVEAAGQHLVLEDVDTHVRIEIEMAGGTLGRYGTYAAAYLQSDPRGRVVSGEHCRFRYEYGRWSIEHLSRTNDTVYNGRLMEHGYEETLRDGKVITLANAISFMVRIY